MLPALELFRLVAATSLKSEPAEDAPETLTLPLSLMLTSPAALALRLATLVLKAVIAEPMLPAVEVMRSEERRVGKKCTFGRFAVEVSDTEVVPVSAPD